MVREVRRWPVMAAASLGVEEERRRRRWKRAKTKKDMGMDGPMGRCVLYMAWLCE
jgi:hypothetical protein